MPKHPVLEELLGMVDEVLKPWLVCNEILNVVLRWHHAMCISSV